MALPTLDATFASSADLPRRQMLAKWLVEEKGETQAPSNVLVSGAGSSAANGTYTYRGEFDGKPYYNLAGAPNSTDANAIVWNTSNWVIVSENGDGYYNSTENVEYPWLAGSWNVNDGNSPVPVVTESAAPSPISNYYDLPERYLWAKIAVAAGAPREEAAYISLPKNYAWSDIYNAVSGDIANSVITVSGSGTEEINGVYVRDGEESGKPKWVNEENEDTIQWNPDTVAWVIGASGDSYWGYSDVAYPWLVQTITQGGGDLPIPTLTVQTPNHTDWSENVALGHIAAAYRGDTGTPANLATYIDWPWRYKVASIIGAFPTNGLLAFWGLNDNGSGALSLVDSSVNGNALTNNNSVILNTGRVEGGARVSASSGQSLTRSDFSIPSTFTISCWVKVISTNSTGTFCGAFGTGATSGPSVNMVVANDLNAWVYLSGPDVNIGQTYVQLILDEWNHMVVTVSTSEVIWYRNNSLVSSYTGNYNHSSTGMCLNTITATLSVGDLVVDSVGVWDRILTSNEIALLYNDGNGVEL